MALAGSTRVAVATRRLDAPTGVDARSELASTAGRLAILGARHATGRPATTGLAATTTGLAATTTGRPATAGMATTTAGHHAATAATSSLWRLTRLVRRRPGSGPRRPDWLSVRRATSARPACLAEDTRRHRP